MNPLDAYEDFLRDPDAIKRAEQFQGYKTMTHPTYPLREEEREHLHRAMLKGASMGQLAALQQMYAKYREAEFPGWREQYEREMTQWLAANGQKLPPCGE